MGASDLLVHLGECGVRVVVAGENLRVMPAERLTDEHRQAIRKHKGDLIVLLTERQTRPYRLSEVDSAIAHAEPWDDGDMARFQARAGLIRRHGFTEQDAQDLAERLHLRDVHADYRHLCLECSHYRRSRCGNYGAAGLKTAAIGHDLATMFQVCAGFGERSER